MDSSFNNNQIKKGFKITSFPVVGSMGALAGMLVPFPGPSLANELFSSLETEDLDMRQVWVELELEWESSLEDDI